MIRSHKIRLYPNNKQSTYFSKACGISRLAYNWGLSEWKKQYESGEKPSAYGLRKQFNSIKREQFPFVYEIASSSSNQSFLDLGKAFSNFFRRVKQGKKGKEIGFPKFKKKGLHDSFYIQNSVFQIKGNSIKIPNLNQVKMSEELRFKGKIMSATISKIADKWFVSISVEFTDTVTENQSSSAVGIDLGISKLATLSDGKVFENPKTTKKYEGRLRLLSKALSRKKKGSNNYKKAKIKLSNLYYRIKCSREDSIHKLTSYVSKKYTDVCIEDLNVKGMVKNRKLSKSLQDASFGEIRRQLEYKCQNIHVIDRFFPSTKLCPQCKKKNEMPLSKRIYECECGYGPVDRDIHAAKNILRQGLSDVKPVETILDLPSKQLSVKQEICLGGVN